MGSELGKELVEALKKGGVDFFMSVPCKLLSGVIASLELDDSITYIPVTREEEAMGIAAGAYLGGRMACLVMQDSGLGNSINALASLIQHFRIPFVLLISYRGTPGEKVGTQVPMAMITEDLLKLLRIPRLHCHRPGDELEIPDMVEHARVAQSAVAILIDFHFVQQRS